MATYRIKLARTDANAERHFMLELDSRMTVLDAPFIIQREHDPSLSFRCSCRVGMCGTCAMRINWMPRLACQTRVETLKADAITIEPLATLPVTKDLVVDLGPFFEKWKKVRPALHPNNRDSKELAIVPPDSEFGKQAQGKRDCITCGACYSVCGITGSNEAYLGPAAINRAMLRLLDPRDGNVDDRLKVLNDETGVWRCHTQFNCVAACPKGIDLTDSIMKMKRAMLFPGKFRKKQRDGFDEWIGSSPWHPVSDGTANDAMEQELRKELCEGHVLFRIPVRQIGHRQDCDDALFELLDGTGRVAVVHLTYSQHPEPNPIWPETRIFDDLEHFARDEMVPEFESWHNK